MRCMEEDRLGFLGSTVIRNVIVDISTCEVQVIPYLCEMSERHGNYFTDSLIVSLSYVKINEYIHLDLVI